MTLNQLRFEKYKKATTKSSFTFENIPPTEDAATQHCYRAYYQLQTWLGNKLTATDWGWKQNEQGLAPKFTEQELIPEVLLKTICCGCTTDCGSARCSCRKHGLKCTSLCTNCHGSEKCTNAEKVIYEELSDSEDITEEEPASRKNRQNNECEDDDSGEEFEDLPEAKSLIEADVLEQPSKKQKLMGVSN